MRSQEQLYIGGKWVAPSGRGSIDVIGAATEEPIGRIPDGNEEDVDRAVKAASAAFAGAARTSHAGVCQGAAAANLQAAGESVRRAPFIERRRANDSSGLYSGARDRRISAQREPIPVE